MRKITLFLFMLFYSCSILFAQKRVVSNEAEISQMHELQLQSFMKEFKIVEVDLKRFKEDVSSPRETRMIWAVDEKTEYDIKIYPIEIRSQFFQAAIVSDNGSIEQEMQELVFKGTAIRHGVLWVLRSSLGDCC